MAIINVSKEQRESNLRIHSGAAKLIQDIRSAIELPGDVILIEGDMPLWCQMVAESGGVLKAGQKPEELFGFFDAFDTAESHHVFMKNTGGELSFFPEPNSYYMEPDAVIGKSGIVRDNPGGRLDSDIWGALKELMKHYGEESGAQA